MPSLRALTAPSATRYPSSWPRRAALLVTMVVTGIATLFAGPVASAHASPPPRWEESKLCTTDEWRNPGNFQSCASKLAEPSGDRLASVKAPVPGAPDSGMAGWFATRPEAYGKPGVKGTYTRYGYAGYDYTTYDVSSDGFQGLVHPEYKFETTVANGEFLLATSIIGASNALRERAWDPRSMWKWADPLVERATRAVYTKVFTVFGAVTLVVVGLYLMWRARQSDMSSAITTAGWALLVMVAVTALARWPVWSANAADHTLISSLSVVHDAVGPPSEGVPADQCPDPEPDACADNRGPALRAGDTAVEGMLARNWLRGLLGTADSDTAKKYGPVLYDAKSFTWQEIDTIRKHPEQRQAIIDAKADRWHRVAAQIKVEDPEAYEYLTGAKGMERIGAGAIAILSSIFFALFDIVASVLVLLGFLVFRWAVVAAPVLGTLGMLRPASAGLRRLANMVIAALFNVIIFGTGAAIYLFAVNLIMGTTSLPGWLQVILIMLTGVVGWMLLRPYRRITQLGGSQVDAESGGWGRALLRDLRAASHSREDSTEEGKRPAGRTGGLLAGRLRPEARAEEAVLVGGGTRGEATAAASTAPAGSASARRPEDAAPASDAPPSRGSAPSRVIEWEEPDVPSEAPSYAVYRPGDRPSTAPAPTRRPESVSLPG